MGMGLFLRRLSASVMAILFLPGADSGAMQARQDPKKKEKLLRKEIQNFDGGILFRTEGEVSALTCFRLDGRATAPHFFDDFKRIDSEQGTEYRSAKENVTEFPEQLHVSFTMYDIACDSRMQPPSPRKYMTQEMMKSLRFSFYWKRGIELRHIDNLIREAALAEALEPYNTASKEELPQRFQWYLKFTIPSAGVPLTDRLVLIIRTPEGRTAARVAARL
jgi:hypothetical protein